MDFKESVNFLKNINEGLSLDLKLKLHEKYGIPMGHPRGRMIYPDGTVEDRDFGKNLIVNKASVLMARRMAPGSAVNVLTGNHIADGFQYLALGTGVGSGTLQSPQEESLEQEILRAEIIRKEFSAWQWLQSDGETPSSEPTNIIELETTFNENEANNALVEMGLFGGNATSSANTGYMFNHKTFPVWNKQVGSILKIWWIITF